MPSRTTHARNNKHNNKQRTRNSPSSSPLPSTPSSPPRSLPPQLPEEEEGHFDHGLVSNASGSQIMTTDASTERGREDNEESGQARWVADQPRLIDLSSSPSRSESSLADGPGPAPNAVDSWPVPDLLALEPLEVRFGEMSLAPREAVQGVEPEVADIEEMEATYRSPPFRQLPLPDADKGSPPPLPVPHRQRVRDSQLETATSEGGEAQREPVSVRPSFPPSHSRSASSASASGPQLQAASGIRHQTLRPSVTTTSASIPSAPIGGLSAHLRGGVASPAPTPLSPSVPHAMLVGASASATPPLVSRPAVGLGVFSGSAVPSPGVTLDDGGRGTRPVKHHHQQEFERDYEREYARSEDGSEVTWDGGRGGYGYSPARDHPMEEGYGYGYPNATRAQHSGAHTYGYGHAQERDGHDGRGDDRRISSGAGARSARGGSGGGDMARMQREREREARERAVRLKEMENEREKEREKKRRANANRVLWAKWDVVDDDRRILTLAYPSSLQIWDTSDLRSIKEVMNVHFDSEEWGLVLGLSGERGRGRDVRERGMGGGLGFDVRVVDARVLTRPSRSGSVSGRRGRGEEAAGKDRFEDVRPVIGILLETAEELEVDIDSDMDIETERKTFFVVYSLRTHQVVKMLGVPGRGETMNVSSEVVVLSTSNPPTLHVLSAGTCEVVYVVPSSALQSFLRPPPAHPTGLAHATSTSSTGTANIISPSNSATGGVSGVVGSAPSGLSLSIANAITNTLSSAAEMGKAISRSTTNSASTSERGMGMGSPDLHSQGHYAFDDQVPYPKPVFTLSGRLLVYASPSPSSNGSSSGSSPVDQNSNASPTPSSLLSNLSRGVGSRMGMTRRVSSSSSASVASGLSTGVGGGSNTGTGNSTSSSPFGGNGAGGGLGRITGMTQAEVGHAALRVGESVFSSVKFLGGMAFEAARSRVGVTGGGASGSRERDGRVVVSRSVPDTPDVDEVAARVLRERRYSHVSSSSALPSPGNAHTTTTTTTVVVTPHTKTSAEHGHYVTVLDLAPLFQDATSQTPRKVDEFNASRSQPVAGLRFAQDGTSVGVITRDGHSVKVFKLFPAPSVIAASQITDNDDQETEAALERLRVHRPAFQTYDLYRGRTSAVVEDAVWARDGRWVALGTRNRTVHVFATNPYGGKPDLRSHLEGRVKGVDVIEQPMTGLTSLARIRGSRSVAQGQVAAPLAFMFLPPSHADIGHPPPSTSSATTHQPSSSFSPSSPRFPGPTMSNTNTATATPGSRRNRNFQDILLFDPATGVLSLRRLVLDQHPVREGVVAAAMGVVGSGTKMRTSVSFPGMGISSSPRTGGMKAEETNPKAQDSGQMELGAKESVMATWDLRRGNDRAEIRVPVHVRSKTRRGVVAGKRDWLSQGEITTSSTSQRVLPRSLYLSHQFTFHTLGEDYHALIRRYQLDGMVGRKIEVRTQVEISGGTGIGIPGGRGPGTRELGEEEGFVEEFQASPVSPQPHSIPHGHGHSHSLTHPHTIQRVSSSFDEPIASAISGTFFDDFDVENNHHFITHGHHIPHSPIHLPPILPMYPNGVPGIRGGGSSAGSGTSRKAVAAATSIRNVISSAIPIRGIGVGTAVVGARLRYKGADGTEGEGVPLEFDEEDEDFVGGANPSVEVEASTATIVPVPHDSEHQYQFEGGDVVGEVDEEIWGDGGWDTQDKEAVEEQEGWGDFVMGGGVGGVAAATGTAGIGGSKLLAGTEERERSAEHDNPRSRKKAGKTKRRA